MGKISKFWIEFLLIFLVSIEMITMEPVWYKGSDGKRYLIDVDQKYNWYHAWNECASYDAQLVAIEDHDKNHILMKILNQLNGKFDNLWIGGNVVYEKVSYHWAVNEQEFTFTNWFYQEVDYLPYRKQCVYVMKHRYNYPWKIAKCDAKEFGFICEEMLTSEEISSTEVVKESPGLPGSMYNGSIYGLIG